MYKIQRFEFFKDYVVYMSIVEFNAYCSIHKRTGLTDEQAKGKFLLEHQREVEYLLRQKKERENKTKLIIS